MRGNSPRNSQRRSPVALSVAESSNWLRVEKIARGIIDNKLKLAIKADCRADYIARYSEDFLALIRRAGFELLYIGAESGSDRILELVQKGVDVSTLHAANARLAAAGIRPHYSFMAGLPGETEADVEAIFDLCRRLSETRKDVDVKRGAIRAAVSWLVPRPHTAMQWEPMRDAEYFWSVRRLLGRLRRRWPAIPAILSDPWQRAI